jgi:hypothetical protein
MNITVFYNILRVFFIEIQHIICDLHVVNFVARLAIWTRNPVLPVKDTGSSLVVSLSLAT